MKKVTYLLGVILSTVLFTTGCGATKTNNGVAINTDKKPATKSVKIGYVDGGKSFPSDLFGIAAEKGYIDEELKKIGGKLELVPFVGAGPAINEALASKSIDLGSLGDVPAIVAKSSGIDTTLVAGGNLANDAAFIVPVDSSIKSVKELKGKRVGTMKGSYMHRTLVEGLKANGLNINDIQFFNMTAPEAESAIIAKKVDAIVAPNTTEARIVLAKNGKIILGCDKNPEWKGSSATVARTEFAKENPEIIVAIIKGLNKSKKFVDENSEEAKKIWTKNGTSKEAYDFLYPKNEFVYTVEPSSKLGKQLTDVTKFLKENNLIKNDVNVDKWIDKSYYEQSLK
ncbi:sulfonate ABC transporter substrate-binding protein [Clostridium polyendosporum]|uniref:Sulfonate ABC transporter substrate-binding protein n=1 Tax=Clostridium polyendosporum TaxID=69208 RepID=A0A919S0W0_9CLOT|nr:aliphatic sulfonate ABC transporter substrate-binding protein [Clostridium polyendosporum]GIM29767.1 sulfonate ABC transporter substrate-binding protein [Clostridium polyendosporum]